MYLDKIGNDIARTIPARYWKGLEADNSNAVIVKREND